MVGSRLGQPGDDHVGVADGLDLLQAEALGEEVERAEDLVEDPDHALGGRPLRERREVDHVGEDHGDVLVALGDDPGLAFEPLGDRRGRTLSRSRSELARAASRARTAY